MEAIIRIIVPALAGILTMSCEPLQETLREEKVEVRIDAGVKTKAALPDDGKIRSLDLLVFRDGGILEAWTRNEQQSISVSVLKGGTYRWYLVANAPEALDSFTREEQFLGSLSHLSDNSPAFPVMEGRGECRFSEDTRIGATLQRLISKVTLETVRADFLKDSYMNSEVRLERVFLLKACATIPYSMASSAGVRYNHTGLEVDSGSSLGRMLCRERGVRLGPESLSENTSLLCCPDPGGETRLVVEISIDGTPNYYPVRIPQMQPNTEYLVKDLVLIGPGAARPYEDVPRIDVSFNVEVSPWQEENQEAYFN